MNIESTEQGTLITPNTVIDATLIESNNKVENTSESKNTNTNHQSILNLDTETKMALDKATGLMQTITTDKITNKVIKKMPTDEYLHLLKLLDTIISGSVNQKI